MKANPSARKPFVSFLLALGATLALGLLLTGCATVQRGTTQTVSVESSPSGAEVFAGSEKLGTTPLEHDFERRTAHRVRIVKEGYEPHEVLLRTVENEAADQFIRFSFEERRGSYLSLEPEEISVELRPLSE
ncbi:MAG: PEGA domain-containing protein [Opitutales bacterium]|nr:PEGA domain-containing protein [Opitutales bacterium]